MKLISDRHRDLYRLHNANHSPPLRPNPWLQQIERFADELDCSTILDYGCGVARGVSRFSRYHVHDYDPGIVEFAESPPQVDLVVSIHALEHVEPERIDFVIEHLRSLALKAALVVVSCEDSTKTLPDGTPWHCLVKPAKWWKTRLRDFEMLPTIKSDGREYAAIYFRE